MNELQHTQGWAKRTSSLAATVERSSALIMLSCSFKSDICTRGYTLRIDETCGSVTDIRVGIQAQAHETSVFYSNLPLPEHGHVFTCELLRYMFSHACTC
jgi:hypothetical protein